MSRIAEIALEFTGRGGKRLRPRLCKTVYEACLSHPVKGSIDAICEAVECFHKASLVHDDIQDGDEVRYGQPSVWKQHGVPVAIAVGDWLVAHGYQLIAHSGFRLAQAMVAATVDSHVRLCDGQGDDLLANEKWKIEKVECGDGKCGDEIERYLAVCERKTGEAFALAAQLGALAAEADDAPWRRWALAYGVRFQVLDDIADGELGASVLAGKVGFDASRLLQVVESRLVAARRELAGFPLGDFA